MPHLFPSDSPNGAEMAEALAECRMIFFAGLPAAGKSLFVQQQALLASQAGMQIHFLRWDAALAAFETDDLLRRYPETDQVAHPVIRKAAGVWSRQAVVRWNAQFPGPDEILIGELPISGNRFAELVCIQSDEAEPLLAGDLTRFLVPVPTTDVRRLLVSKRQSSIANPQHADETRDAPMNTLDHVWRETLRTATDLGLVRADGAAATDDYDPTIYSLFFEHLLQHRNSRILSVDTIYRDVGSAHDLHMATHEILASPDEVADVLKTLDDTMTLDQIVGSVESWHEV